VAQEHYDGLEPHVTLLSEELIGKYTFNDSTIQCSLGGSNIWGDSGAQKPESGFRPWLNSYGSYSSPGFCHSFSNSFKEAVVATKVPNRDWRSGDSYEALYFMGNEKPRPAARQDHA
jgi:hypothetical protein